MGVDTLVGDRSDSSPECEELEDELLGYRSGALYESMFVVEINSIGPEILFLIVPKVCFVVVLLLGMLSAGSCDLALRLEVNARERDIFAR